tara:strand:+ start:1120 stop:1470 length:351 start_codon:yes stop_codon:yes gene_type:complete
MAFSLNSILPNELCSHIQGYLLLMEEQDRIRAKFQWTLRSVRLFGVCRELDPEIWGPWDEMLWGDMRTGYELVQKGHRWPGERYGLEDFTDPDDDCYCEELCEFYRVDGLRKRLGQ